MGTTSTPADAAARSALTRSVLSSQPLQPTRHIRRVLTCMGTAQLVSALSAAATRQQQQPADVAHDDFLIIHDLYAPPGQDRDFAHCVEQLARSIWSWKQVVYLPPSQLASWVENQSALAAGLELDRVDELHLPQNRLPLTRSLAAAFPQAKRYCYGDAFGLNFSHEYFAPRKPLHQLRAWWRGVLQRCQVGSRMAAANRSPSADTLTFDDHYLLYPNRFDQILDTTQLIDLETYREFFRRIGETLDETAEWYQQLCEVAGNLNDVVILMTSNFSESGKMELDGELRSYQELLAAESGKTLVIKPHPRDSQGKIQALQRLCRDRFQRMIVLDHPSTFYLPFESVLARCFGDALSRQKPAVICVSSACVALQSLFGIGCRLGFGEAAVRRHFRRKWVAHRLEHERDLQRVLNEIRDDTTARNES